MRSRGRRTAFRLHDSLDLVLIGSTHAMSDGFSNLLVPVLTLIVADLNLSDTQAGFLLSTLSLSAFLFVFPISLVSDHSGRRLQMLLLGMTIAAAAYTAMLGAKTLAALLVLSFLAGAGNAVYHPCGTALTAERFPSVKPYAISVHGMMGNIGASLMPIVLALVAGALGWRAGIAICTIPLVILLPTLGIRFRSVLPEYSPPKHAASFLKNSVAIVRKVFRERNVLLLAVVYALSGMATKAAVGFIPLLAERRFEFSTSAIGLLLAIYFGMGIAAKPIMALVYAKLGPKRALQLPLVVSFVCTLAIGFAPWPAVFVIVVAVVGATSPISPIILTAAADFADSRILASSVGLIYSLHAIGFIAPAVAGILAEWVGISYAYVFAAVLFLAGGVVTAGIRGGEPT